MDRILSKYKSLRHEQVQGSIGEGKQQIRVCP